MFLFLNVRVVFYYVVDTQFQSLQRMLGDHNDAAKLSMQLCCPGGP